MKVSFYYFLLIACLLFSPNAFGEARNICETTPRALPELELKIFSGEIQYDFTKNPKDLTRILKATNGQLDPALALGPIMSPFFITGDALGLTVGEYSYRLLILPFLQQVQKSPPAFCAKIKKIVVNFYYNSNIYVARQFPVNSCEFNVIMRHEMKHHEANMANKTKYLGWVREGLAMVANDILKQYRPIRQNNIERLVPRIRRDLEDALDVYIFNMYRDTQRQNRLIDSADEYLQVNRALRRCKR